MEELVVYIVNFVISLADKYSWLGLVLMIIGGLYSLLTMARAFLTKLVDLTKTEKDNEIVLAVYAFLDKFSYGFGPLADYYEKKTSEKK